MTLKHNMKVEKAVKNMSDSDIVRSMGLDADTAERLNRVLERDRAERARGVTSLMDLFRALHEGRFEFKDFFCRPILMIVAFYMLTIALLYLYSQYAS